MRRRDFAIGLLLMAAAPDLRAQQQEKPHRIAIVIGAGPVATISETSSDTLSRRLYQPFFEELRRLGHVEGQDLIVERYSAEARPGGFANLAREVVGHNPAVVVAISNSVALAAQTASDVTPIVWIGVDPIAAGLVTSLARPGGNITGVSLFDYETYAKRLQILKDAAPSAQKVGYLTPRNGWEGADVQPLQRAFRQVGHQLGMSVIPQLVEESTATEYQRVFAAIEPGGLDAIIVSDRGDHFPHLHLIIELIEKSRLPAIYGYREFVAAGGLISYGADLGELGQRMADDVHEILNGAEPRDIPIYQATKFDLAINLRAANALGITLPPALLARVDEVIE